MSIFAVAGRFRSQTEQLPRAKGVLRSGTVPAGQITIGQQAEAFSGVEVRGDGARGRECGD